MKHGLNPRDVSLADAIAFFEYLENHGQQNQ